MLIEKGYIHSTSFSKQLVDTLSIERLGAGQVRIYYEDGPGWCAWTLDVNEANRLKEMLNAEL